MKKTFSIKNISGSLLMLSDLGNKRLSYDPEKIYTFTNEDLNQSKVLRELISNRFLLIVNNNEDEKSLESPDIFAPKAENPIETKKDTTKFEDNRTNPDDITSFGDEIIEKNYPKIQEKEEFSPSQIINQNVKEIWWCGPANDAGGYGKMNRECLERLFNKKDLRIHHETFGLGDARARLQPSVAIKTMMETKVADDATSVWAIMPPKFFTRNGRKILFTMIESKNVPPQFLKKCNNADELWVPSQHNLEAFQEAGISIPVYKIPLGVDIERFKPFKIDQQHYDKIRNIKTKSFVFTSLFGWSLRKGADILLRSYLEEFSPDDDVTLMIVSRNWGSASSENNDKIRTDIKNYIKRHAKNPDRPPHIVHVGQPLPEEDLPIIYNMSDAFILMSRGEGFSLTPMEAGSCETPVIATRIGGHEDYLNDENSYLINVDGYDSTSQEIKEISKLASYYEGQPFANLGIKAIGELKEKMRHILNNYPEAKEKAKLLRQNIVENFTWDHMAERVYKRLVN